MTPATGEGTSRLTLSVSSSTSGSSTATLSPTFFSHFATVASLTDSPSFGTRISTLIAFPLVPTNPHRGPGLRAQNPRASSAPSATPQPSSASDTRAFCSRSCCDKEPVAGEADGLRPA